MFSVVSQIRQNYKGILAVIGAFLVQLAAGSYHGTFGNMLPYLTSYVKQVRRQFILSFFIDFVFVRIIQISIMGTLLWYSQ